MIIYMRVMFSSSEIIELKSLLIRSSTSLRCKTDCILNAAIHLLPVVPIFNSMINATAKKQCLCMCKSCCHRFKRHENDFNLPLICSWPARRRLARSSPHSTITDPCTMCGSPCPASESTFSLFVRHSLIFRLQIR